MCVCVWQLIWTARNGGKLGELTETAEVFISYLPLSHVAAQILDIFIPMIYAVTVYFAQPDALKVKHCSCRHCSSGQSEIWIYIAQKFAKAPV